ncbi:Detected protein of confused Function [Hibiscus syriacus]|uniref:N-acetyl-D-glucosamine kinase n=1 Tax=Hibiscus syriacus TaxID=106335 RepID=A0A6A2ZV08_HIBSY|nr:Detected protein of confused Function [Hibiscus syriacus]
MICWMRSKQHFTIFGHKTYMQLVDANALVINSSFSFTETAAREILEQVMANALSKSGSNRSSVRAVCLAISGVNHPTDQQRILTWLSQVKLYVRNDAVAALASGTMGKLHGCVPIAGTVAYGFTEDGREARAAGAGPVLELKD